MVSMTNSNTDRMDDVGVVYSQWVPRMVRVVVRKD